MPGAPSPVCYLEIPAPSPKDSAEFYAAVFAWVINPSSLTDLNYWMFNTGENQLAGGFCTERAVQPDGIIFYISVSDIHSTLKTIQEKGGTLCSEKEAVGGDYGFTATFKDPAGNRVGLWSQN